MRTAFPSGAQAAPRPRPFRQIVLKLSGRCNLACDYCYVYHGMDSSWRTKPATMPMETVVAVADRLMEHATANDLDAVSVILHGGEPLLVGPARLREILAVLRGGPSGTVRIDMHVQTNGTLLTVDMLETLRAGNVWVGVSLDGGADANDRHRRTVSGRGSHRSVLDAVGRLRSARYRHLFAGLLSTIDVATDPVRAYEDLAELEPPQIDFLLPHANWSTRPPGNVGSTGDPPYGRWLGAIFDRWYREPARVPVRMFTEIIQLLVGGASRVEYVGLTPSDCVVIDTDGSIERSDVLKTAFAGAPQTGLSVLHDSLADASAHPDVLGEQRGLANLCAVCLECRVRDVCGGGMRAHRYSTRRQFANPSVYCPDLMWLIDHIRTRLSTDMNRALDCAGSTPS